MKCRVVFSPEAEEQLAELYRYIAGAVSPVIAERYVNVISATARRWRHHPCEVPGVTTFA